MGVVESGDSGGAMRELGSDSRLTALYRRLGPRYVTLTMLAGCAAAVLVAGAGAVIGGRLAAIGVADTVFAALILFAYQSTTLSLAMWRMRDELRLLRTWAAGTDRADPERRRETLRVAFDLGRRTVVSVGPYLAVAPLLIVARFAFDDGEFHAGTAIGTGLGGVSLILYAVTVGYQSIDFLARPIRLEVGTSATRADLDGLGAAPVTAKILVGAATTALVLGFTTAAVVAPAQDWSEAWTIVLVTLVLFGTVGLSMALLLARNTLAPVGDLARGTAAVAGGDLGTRVPVTSTDELGELAASFNEMVDGLREREALRAQKDELLDELQESRARIVAASDDARRKVERDLHDGAQQHLVLLNLKLNLAERTLSDDPGAAAEILDEAHADLNRALAELRDLAHGIYPAVLTSDGLPGALAEVVAQAPIPASLECDGAGRYPPEIEAAVYFCCLEALQNAAKHAGDGTAVRVKLHEGDGELRFEVADDGAGFEADTTDGSAGLQNMADRIGALGGELRVQSSPGAGTRVAGVVPLTR